MPGDEERGGDRGTKRMEKVPVETLYATSGSRAKWFLSLSKGRSGKENEFIIHKLFKQKNFSNISNQKQNDQGA